MSRREEQALAARLARALDGQERPEGDVATLVTVLERATEPARFQVPEEEIERELARVRPRLERQPASRPASRLAVAFGAVAAAAIAVVVFTFVRLPGTDVEAKALAALGGPSSILELRERIESVRPGMFPSSTRTSWLDSSRGIAHWVQLAGGRRMEEVLVERGRMRRFLPAQHLLIVGSSCRAFASGCAELVDPVAFYRRALAGSGAVRSKREGDVYRLTLPLQSLPDAVRIEQVVTVDADTFLPKLIEWRENGRPVSRIKIESIERIPRSQVFELLDLRTPARTRVEQRTASGKRLRKEGEKHLTLAEARTVRPRLVWYGPEYGSRKLRSIERVDWNAGSAYRFRYGRVTLWNFSDCRSPGSARGESVGSPQVDPGRRERRALLLHAFWTCRGRDRPARLLGGARRPHVHEAGHHRDAQGAETASVNGSSDPPHSFLNLRDGAEARNGDVRRSGRLDRPCRWNGSGGRAHTCAGLPRGRRALRRGARRHDGPLRRRRRHGRVRCAADA